MIGKIIIFLMTAFIAFFSANGSLADGDLKETDLKNVVVHKKETVIPEKQEKTVIPTKQEEMAKLKLVTNLFSVVDFCLLLVFSFVLILLIFFVYCREKYIKAKDKAVDDIFNRRPLPNLARSDEQKKILQFVEVSPLFFLVTVVTIYIFLPVLYCFLVSFWVNGVKNTFRYFNWRNLCPVIYLFSENWFSLIACGLSFIMEISILCHYRDKIAEYFGQLLIEFRTKDTDWKGFRLTI